MWQQIKWIPFLYLLGINLWAFFLFGWDKFAAKRGSSRVSERRLLGVIGAGGVLGAGVAMRLFRHKTRKMPFRQYALWVSVLGWMVIAGIFAFFILNST